MRFPRAFSSSGSFALAMLISLSLHAADVSLTINGQPAKPGDYKPADVTALVIDNGIVQISFGKDVNGDFSGTSVKLKGKELADNLHGIEPRDVDAKRTFYLDYGAGRGHLQADTVRIVKNTPDLAHFAVIDGHNPIHLEHHFVMLKGESGIHPYVIIKTNGGNGGGEMRTMYRFNRDILDYAWCVERTGQQPKYADLVTYKNVQDETWQLPDGSIYQKYDYCAYFSESPMWGHYGHGYGAFFIPTSTESYAGGPLRQELIVHQDALILNYLGGGHFGGGGTAAGTATGEKIHGPWFLYFNTGDSPKAIIDDALQVAKAEKAKWPYQWVEEPLYPTKRTNVSGQLKVADGRSPGGAWVMLGGPGGDVYRMAGDYIFYVKADENGHFALNNVRPGTYTLYAWANQGTITDLLQKPDVKVSGDSLDLGTVDWKPTHRNNLLWQIGKADMMAGEFKFGDQLRSMMWVDKVPANLTYTIGKSNSATDWYYAQTQVGQWDVNFDLNKTYSGNAYLSVATAGGGGGASVTVSVNGQDLQTIAPGNDASTYRAALRSGVYGLKVMTFPASALKQGQNTVRFNMTSKGGRWNGIMWDTIILEAD